MRHCTQLLISALLVGGTILATGCATRADGPETPGEQAAAIHPLPEAASVRFYSGMMSRERLVVRDPSTWATVWPQIVGSVQPVPDLPKVDFASEFVVVAAMGRKPTGGFSISIDAFDLTAGDASITIVEQSPGARCAVTATVTSPVSVVVVPRFSGKATFVEQTSQRDC